MRTYHYSLILFVCLLTIISACNQAPPALPTQVAVAQLPTELPPTAVGLPPTTDFSQLKPTQEPTPVVTRLPTATPTPIVPLINITAPDKESEVIMGQELRVLGLVQKEANQTVWLDLISNNGRSLAILQGVVGEVGWETSFNVPPFVSGAAILRASIRDEAGGTLAISETPITLALDTENSDRYLDLYRPLQGERAVAGFNFFFDGRVQRPVNNTVTISIWVDEDCQTRVAKQSFALRGSGYWQGFVVIPRDIEGSGCAVAHFGEPGSETWREAQVPIEIAAEDNDQVLEIEIGNPPPGSTLVAGQELLLYGTASLIEDSIQVRIQTEEGRIVSDNTAVTDFFGYWELQIILPIDVEGPAQISAIIGDFAGPQAESTILVTIEPAPTPTPIP